MLTTALYKPSFWFRNTHINTIFSGRYRHVPMPNYRRERVTTTDDDFVNVDWVDNGSERVVILVHGLGGHSRRHHIMGLANAFTAIGYDVAAFNFRGTGEESNNRLKSYHSGDTGDLRVVIQQIIDSNKYKSINLVGYSLGGNVILKYLGEEHLSLSKLIKKAAVMSVPCELKDSSERMKKWDNKIYLYNFFKTLKPEAIEKDKRFPGVFDLKKTLAASNFFEFDDAFTAPINGFRDAIDYYGQSSSLYFLDWLTIPTYMLQAEDDTFLSDTSFPRELAENHPLLHLEISKYGGHVGFYRKSKDGRSWAELRICAFIDGKVN